jgi:hypothetical protein
MDFAHPGTDACRSIDLVRQRIDEYRRADAGIGEPCHRRLELRLLSGNVESTFCRDLVAALGDQHGHFGPQPARDRQHLVRRRHFEIELDVHQFPEPAHILVLDVPPILAQMHSDAVGPA